MGAVRSRVLIVVAALLVVGAVAAVLLRDGAEEGVGDALGIAEDEGRFASSVQAGDTFALIAGIVLDDARTCVAERSRDHAHCIARSEAAAYVQAVAVTAVDCTAPGIFELRRRTAEYLRAVEAVEDVEDAERPPVPAIPSCEE